MQTRRGWQTALLKDVLPINFANCSTYPVASINGKCVGFDENNLEKMTNRVLRILSGYLFLANANLSSVSFSSATTPHRGETIPNENEYPFYSIFQKNKTIFPIKFIQIITYTYVSKNEFFLKKYRLNNKLSFFFYDNQTENIKIYQLNTYVVSRRDKSKTNFLKRIRRRLIHDRR